MAKNLGQFYTANAAVDLTGKEGYIVKLDVNGNAALATATSDAILGVIERGAKATDSVDIRLVNGVGTNKVVAGANNIAVGDLLTVNGSGQAVKATQTAGGTAPAVRVIGRALEASSTVGDFITYLLFPVIY